MWGLGACVVIKRNIADGESCAEESALCTAFEWWWWWWWCWVDIGGEWCVRVFGDKCLVDTLCAIFGLHIYTLRMSSDLRTEWKTVLFARMLYLMDHICAHARPKTNHNGSFLPVFCVSFLFCS